MKDLSAREELRRMSPAQLQFILISCVIILSVFLWVWHVTEGKQDGLVMICGLIAWAILQSIYWKIWGKRSKNTPSTTPSRDVS
jgi:hypothetical protein